MTDQLDSAPAAGTEGSPKPEGSQQQGGQQGSGVDVSKLQKTLDALVKRQDEIDARTRSLQGDKDRGVKQTRAELDEIKRQFAEIEKMKNGGMELDDAVAEFDFRQTVRDLKDQLSKLNPVSAQDPGKEISGAVEETQNILKDYKLDGNDPAVQHLFSLKGAELKAAAADLAYRRATQPQPSPSSASALQGGPAGAPVDKEGISEKITSLMANPRQNQKEIAELSAKLREAK